MAGPCSETWIDRMRSLFNHRHCHSAAATNSIGIPVATFKRTCKRLVVFVLEKMATQPLLLYTVLWTLTLAATVTAAAVSLEMGFSTAITPHMEVAEACALQSSRGSPLCRQCVRLPLDGPRDALCVPASMFRKSAMDFAVPPVFAALVVTASALLVQTLGLWSP